MNKILGIFAALMLGSSLNASAQTIVGYDVLNYSQNQLTGWTSSYTGKTTFPGNGLINLTGGSGTLNDGAISNNSFENMLFLSTGAVIVLRLDKAVALSGLDMFGGDYFSNGIPGMITGASFSFGGASVSMNSTGFGAMCPNGPCNDHFEFNGTALQGVLTNTITISDIRSRTSGFNITEITVAATATGPLDPGTPGPIDPGTPGPLDPGTPALPVPEPETYALMLAGVGLLGLMARRRRTRV